MINFNYLEALSISFPDFATYDYTLTRYEFRLE